jgi:hypothetical protein
MTPIKRVVALLLLLQVISISYLWTASALGTVSAAKFAVFLATNLLSFAIVAYIYTHDKWGEIINRAWILTGAVGLILLLLSSLYFP